MIISETRKYIYVAVPKTGSRSIQKYLQEYDPDARFNEVPADDKWVVVGDRDEAWKIQQAMGETYEQYQTFAFIRHPYSKIVSSYFFFRNGEPLHDNTWANFRKSGWGRKGQLIFTNLKILSTIVLPFKIWALIYPYKSNLDYICDLDGNPIVNHVGLYERLSEDFARILRAIKFPTDGYGLPHINRSTHKDHNDYFRGRLFRKLVDRKVGRDLEFYEQIKNKYEGEAGADR